MADPGAVSWTASSNGHHGLYRAPWRAGDANHPRVGCQNRKREVIGKLTMVCGRYNELVNNGGYFMVYKPTYKFYK
jgi:hypothetical protein